MTASLAIPTFKKVQEKRNAIKAQREVTAGLPPSAITEDQREELDELGRQSATESKKR